MINQIIDLKIEKDIFGGKGIGYYNNNIIMVDKAIARQILKIKVIKKYKNIYFGEIIDIVYNPYKTRNECKHFFQCGGCSYSFIDYDPQFDIKKTIFLEQINNNVIFKNTNIQYYKSIDSFFYRNKAEFSFNYDYKNNIIEIGFHKLNKYDKIIGINNCFLINVKIQEILNVFNNVLNNYTQQYDISLLQGLKHLLIRAFDKTMICIEIENKNNNLIKFMYDLLNTNQINVIALKYNNNIKYITTEKTIIAHIGKYKYNVGADTFFQTNTNTCKILYDTIYNLLEPAEHMCEMYGGVCSIGIYVSDKFKKIISSDINTSNIELAKQNLILNNITNINLICLSAEKFLNNINDNIDTLIVDPARSGLHKNVFKYIQKTSPKQVIYISCNMSTLLRDLILLFDIGYDIIDVIMIDMFPYTYHIEIVVNLKKNNKFKF